MAPSPIISWQIDGKTMETVRDFIFLGSKLTAGGDCSHEIKTLVLWKKSYDNLDSILKAETLLCSQRSICDLSLSQGCGFASSQVWMLRVGL